MTTTELPARAANIQRAVAATTTCTATTVESLRSFLFQAEVPALSKQSKATYTPAPSGRTASRVKGNVKSKKKPEAAGLEVAAVNKDEEIQTHERYSLATKVVNISLKSLNDAIKNPPTAKRKTNLRRTSSNGSFNQGCGSRSQTPLQPISVNRLSSKTGDKGLLRRSSSSTSPDATIAGLRAQAECCRIAFATLRLTEGQAGSSNLPELQLESGMSALIGKMITLGFEDLAAKELRVLKRRLDSCTKIRPQTSNVRPDSIAAGNQDSMEADAEKLEDLLYYSKTDAVDQLLALIVTTQVQTIKVLALRKDMRSIQAALRHLKLDVPSSPVNMIQRQVKSGSSASRNKAAQQLEGLAQSFLGFGSSFSLADDAKIPKSSNCLPPDVVFDFQLLALQMRQIWWKLSGHHANLVAELIDPFRKFLSVLHRRSAKSKEEKYETAKVSLVVIEDYARAPTGSLEEALLLVYHIMTDLAQECSRYEEAIEWVKKARSCTRDGKTSQVKVSSLDCRLALLHLRTFDSHPSEPISNALIVAAKSLSGDLQGESGELDELLINVASLRRSVLSLFQKAHKPSDSGAAHYSSALIDRCVEIILLCPKFVLRYVGSGSKQCENDKMRKRRDQRLCLAGQVSTPIIESVAVVARLLAQTENDVWEKLDAGLQDSYTLAIAIGNVSVDNAQIIGREKPVSTPFASISNAYWARYLHLKQQTEHLGKSREHLRTSIEVIKGRSLPEMTAGMLPLKLEKYAQICESRREYGKAAATYQQALLIQIDIGSLEKAREAARVGSLPDALDSNPELEPLTRIVSAYPRLATKANAQGGLVESFLDIHELCLDGRGVLLEMQLIALLSSYDPSSLSVGKSESVNKLGKILLLVYSLEVYPVRRLRVIVRLLAFLTLAPNALDSELQELLLKPTDVSKEAHADKSLVQFLPHLVTSHEVIANLRLDELTVKKVETIMAKWSEMLRVNTTWELLQSQCYDMSEWLSLLELLADFLDMKGLALTRVSVLHALTVVHEAATSKDCSSLVSKLSLLGVQYARLGYSSIAETILLKAHRYMKVSDVSADIAIRWQVNYAEHALHVKDLAKCENHLDKAQKLFEERCSGNESQNLRSKERNKLCILVSDAYQVYSLLAAEKGQLADALYNARCGVRIIQRLWTTLERSNSKNASVHQLDKDTTETDTSLANALSGMSIDEKQVTKSGEMDSSMNCVPFWALASRLFFGLIRLSQLFAFHGLLQEVKYYMAQARKVADSVKASYFISEHSSCLGKYLMDSGESVEGRRLLQDAPNGLDEIPHDRLYAQLQLHVMESHIEHGRKEDGMTALARAERTLQNIMRINFLDELIHQPMPLADLAEQVEKLTIKEPRPKREPLQKGRQADSSKKINIGTSVSEKVKQYDPPQILATDVIALYQTKAEVLRGRVLLALSDGALETAMTILGQVGSLPCNQQERVLQAVLAAQIRFHEGIGKLISDPVLCVLPESTVSCPSIKAFNERQGLDHSPQKRAKPSRGITAKTSRPKSSTAKAPSKSPVRCRSEVHSFDLAQRSLNEIFKLAKTYSMTSTIHETTKLLGKILIILSVTDSKAWSCSSSPTSMAYILETGRSLSMMREAVSIQVEANLTTVRNGLDWPKKDGFRVGESNRIDQGSEVAAFQTDYIDVIPTPWTVISMTLSETREEILFCKIRAGQPPLVLRLPLNRQSPLEEDKESFGFDEVKDELQDIIRLTNESTHGGQDLSQKGAKTKWWEARSTLDARLKDLLINVENIWFGGFRGMFSPRAQNEGLLARLRQSLQNILNKHLPSRQKPGRAAQSSSFTFDLDIMELFTGLGVPSENHDVDEPLMDLLYFVVDILQFNGERNAYDEVDFDSIAIETIDALRQYHQAVRDEAAEEAEQHTILIVDKHLHCFPWESLPCLAGRPVSRLPSLQCVRDRILYYRERQSNKDGLSFSGERFYVNRNSGASILNPGGDLKATESKFDESLQGLSGWDTMVQREPTETEFKTLLEDREILLYFGHGSGSQYIRSRTIKKLETCAVALLMGCSSGAMTECGKFESYGTPLNYMHAGSPAVLATLWDVTDKDIDRFSQTVLEEWGLFQKSTPPISSSPVKKSAREKGKSKVMKTEEQVCSKERSVSLDMAVSRGRDSCLLKYLNGAAPVVYGIPIFLS